MKKLLTVDKLIEHMQNKGIRFDIESVDNAKVFLSQNNYYMKLASYRTNYKKKPSGEYIRLDFAYLKELSTIDMHLRYIILQMTLDIEHFLKVRLLHSIENNPSENGYRTVQKFLAADKNFRILKDIQVHKSSDYCKELIEKYYPYFPAWVFIELISFGTLAHLCEFYSKEYGTPISDRILLNSVKDIRNASAHSNCLINVLTPGNNKAHNSVTLRLKSYKEIGESSRDKKLSNKFIYDFVCLLFAYDEIVSSTAVKQKRYVELQKLFDERMLQHKDWFLSNNLITSSYRFVKVILDKFGATW